MKKYLSLGLSLVVLVLSLGTAAAFAQTATTTASVASTSTGPMIVNIGPAGNVLLRGQVVSVGTDSLVVKSWGGSWTVNTLSTTEIVSANKTLSDFKADDFVGVLGTISADGDFEIDAKILRAWGHRADSDHDGIPDNQDNDDDNDGVENHSDAKLHDHDDDGIADSLDSDDDNDGIADTEDAKPHDHDNDGINDGEQKRHGDREEMLKKMFMLNRGPGSVNSGKPNTLFPLNPTSNTVNPMPPLEPRDDHRGSDSSAGSGSSGSDH